MLLRPVLMPILRNPLQGIADGIRNMLAELLGSSQFFAPLTHSLVLARGTGSPTFTRASTATFPDWEGVLRTVPSGCARFEGARMVRNIIPTTSENFDNAAWTKTNAGAGSVPVVTADQDPTPVEGVAFADKVVFDAPGAGDNSILSSAGFTGIVGNTYTGSFYVKAFALGDVGKVILFRHVGSAGFTPVTLTTSYQRFQLNQVGIGAATFDIGLRPTFGGSTGTVSVYLAAAQCENVTGQADQTASEYVSVGVLSAPYHGAGVDGVKFFNTDRDGALLSPQPAYLAEGGRENKCLQSNAFTTTWGNSSAAPTQNAIGPDGATSAWTLTDSSAVATAYITQAITLTAAAHTVSLKVKKTAGAQSSYPVILALTGAGSILSGVTVDTSNGIATPWTSFTGYTIASGVSVRCASHSAGFWQVEMTFTATAASWSFYLEPAGALTPTLATVGTDVSAQGSAVFYGAQVELGSSASTYTPTTTAAVTRAADVLTYPSAGNIDGTVGWACCEINLDFIDTATNNWMIVRDNGSGIIYSNGVDGQTVIFDGTDGAVKSGLGTFVGTNTKLASTWGGSTQSVTGDGLAPASAAFDGNLNITSTIGIGSNSTGNLWGTIRNVRIGQRQLSASEMQAITSQ